MNTATTKRRRRRYTLQVWRRGRWVDVARGLKRNTAKYALMALRRYGSLDWRAVREESDCGR
jgi:hypothetical protein